MKGVFRKFVLVPTLSAVLYVGVLVPTWIFQTRASLDAGADVLSAACEDAIAGVGDPVDSEFFHVASTITRGFASAADFAASEADGPAAVAKRHGYRLVNAVDTNGVIIASSDPRLVGFALEGRTEAPEFLALASGDGYFKTPFMPLADLFKGVETGGGWCKLVGLPFPKGGFVQVGDSHDDVSERRYIFEDVFRSWHIGESGCLMLVDRVGGKVVSAYEEDWTGRELASLCPDVSAFPGPDNELSICVLDGRESLVRYQSVEFVKGVDAFIVLPLDEVYYSRNRSFAMIAVVLFSILLIGNAVLLGFMRKQALIDALRRREDEHARRDLAIARDIQNSALPSNFRPIEGPLAPDLHAFMRAAREVGGDFYDFVVMDESHLLLVIADVSDKGIPAAMFMMKTKDEIEAAVAKEHDPAAVMTKVNGILAGANNSGMFVTAWIGSLDLSTGELEYVSAGHNPPFVRRADGSVEPLPAARALVLAAMPGVRYRSQRAVLAPGDRLVLYTDGVTEAKNDVGGFYGEERVKTVLAASDASSSGICERILRDIDEFAGPAPQADDITVLAVGIAGSK